MLTLKIRWKPTKQKQVLISIFIILVISCCTAEKQDADLMAIKDGETVFDKYCMSCHGVNSQLPVGSFELSNFLSVDNSYKEYNDLHIEMRGKMTSQDLKNLKSYILFEKDNKAKY